MKEDGERGCEGRGGGRERVMRRVEGKEKGRVREREGETVGEERET